MSAASSDIPQRSLGRTGEKVSCIGLGGWHLALPHVDAKLATRLIHGAIERGVTFMDNCWDYNDGDSEKRMGKALADGRRQQVFLMTKIDGRSYASATKQLEESLKRLKTDTIDLVQHHEMLRFDDADRIFRDDGAQRALEDARRAGKLRFIGFTGHKDPRIHLHVLEVALQRGVTFDAVQMPLNVMDAHFRSFERQVVPLLVRQGVGVLGMKSMANGRILQSKTVSATECLHYALNLPTSVVITGCESMENLEQACEAARTFKPMTERQVVDLLARTAEAAHSGDYELFKTTSIYDGTAKNPDWLGEEPRELVDTVQA
jgi:predicted aldo/keto reductase-like oxidoreductase